MDRGARPLRQGGRLDRASHPGAGCGGQALPGAVVVTIALTFAVSVITGPGNSFVFLYAQDVIHQRGIITAAMVVGGGVTGLLGLLAGRWLADRFGRRPTGALALVSVAVVASLAYSGSAAALI